MAIGWIVEVALPLCHFVQTDCWLMSVGSENSFARTNVAAQLTRILCHNLEYMRLYYHISRMLWLCAAWFYLHGIFPQPQFIISNSNQFIYSYAIFSTFYICIFLFLLLNHYHCVCYPTNISYTYSYFLSILRALWWVKDTLTTNPCLSVCHIFQLQWDWRSLCWNTLLHNSGKRGYCD
jgi:hypothetical protein